jgi:hypothetical protein
MPRRTAHAVSHSLIIDHYQTGRRTILFHGQRVASLQILALRNCHALLYNDEVSPRLLESLSDSGTSS